MFPSLKKQGVLGINARIGTYMNPLNARKHYPMVDNKILTAKLAEAHDLPMPKNYFVFETYGDARHLAQIIAPYPSFVLKPAHGSQGNGILVVESLPTDSGQTQVYQKPNGTPLSMEDLRYHILTTISGLYSLSGYADQVLLQYKIQLHPMFENYSFQGIPDIRVLVYRGYPVMAMTRLPTHVSGGRANLHQGAVGAGLDMQTGRVIAAICHNHRLEHHPDTQHTLEDLVIPHWYDLLEIAAQCYDMAPLGYLGVDLVIDANLGPMVLEMNARPGLSIQIANQKGLNKILKLFKAHIKDDLAVKQRVEFALELLRRENWNFTRLFQELFESSCGASLQF